MLYLVEDHSISHTGNLNRIIKETLETDIPGFDFEESLKTFGKLITFSLKLIHNLNYFDVLDSVSKKSEEPIEIKQESPDNEDNVSFGMENIENNFQKDIKIEIDDEIKCFDIKKEVNEEDFTTDDITIDSSFKIEPIDFEETQEVIDVEYINTNVKRSTSDPKIDENKVRFIHGEYFSGLLVGFSC